MRIPSSSAESLQNYCSLGLCFALFFSQFFQIQSTLELLCCRHVRNDPEIQKLRATGNLGADADIVENILLAFGSVGRTLLTMLTYMLGDFDLDPIHYLHMPGRLSALSQGKTLRNATILVLILYVFSISILLLNLLIAIMADSFQRMKDTEEPEFFHARALAIDDLESMISEKKKNTICSRQENHYCTV